MDEQDVVQQDSDEWDEDGDDDMEIDLKKESKKSKKSKKAADEDEMEAEIADVVDDLPEAGGIWNDQARPLEEDEELEFDSSAYEMLHRSAVEWPCLSIDIIVRDRIGGPTGILNQKSWFPSQMGGVLSDHDTVFDKRLNLSKHKQDTYPMTTYFVGGSQSEDKNQNKLYVMKWSDMEMTLNDDKPIADNSSDDEDDIIEKLNNAVKEPTIKFESVPHKGCVNRLRSLHGTGIVATWNEEGEVGIYNVSQAIDDLDAPPAEKEVVEMTAVEALTANQKKKLKKKKAAAVKKTYGGSKITSFKHKDEGYALEWSPHSFGRLASGSCDAHLWLYVPADENCSTFIKETQVGLQGHKGSIEDIQWSPSQEQVLATCSVDGSIKLWDLRATQMKC